MPCAELHNQRLDLGKIMARELREEVVLDLILEPPLQPIIPPAAVDITCLRVRADIIGHARINM